MFAALTALANSSASAVGAAVQQRPVSPWSALTIFGCCFLFLVVALSLRSKRQSEKQASDRYADHATALGLRMLLEDFSYLLERYRRLDYDHKQDVRFPRSFSSWPKFGEKWQYVHANLYSLAGMTDWAMVKAKLVWRDYGWPEYTSRLFSQGDDILMVDMLVGLQEGIDWLKRQIQSTGSSQRGGEN